MMSHDNFNNLVLIKSTPEDDFDFKLRIAFFTCVSLTGVREKCRFLPFSLGSMSYIGIFLSIVLTFFGKKLLKVFATSSSDSMKISFCCNSWLHVMHL